MLKLDVIAKEDGKVTVKATDDGNPVSLSTFAGKQFMLVPVPEPSGEKVQWTWNDGIGNRSRKPLCFIVTENGEVSQFTGRSIDGEVTVLGSDYCKNGKWSNTTYRCISPAGTSIVSWMQDWENGLAFPQDLWEQAYAWLLTYAPQADFESFKAIVSAHFPETAERFNTNRKAYYG